MDAFRWSADVVAVQGRGSGHKIGGGILSRNEHHFVYRRLLIACSDYTLELATNLP